MHLFFCLVFFWNRVNLEGSFGREGNSGKLEEEKARTVQWLEYRRRLINLALGGDQITGHIGLENSFSNPIVFHRS